MPVFVVILRAVSQFKRTGPIWDTFDEIAQYKLVYGLASGIGVWALAVLLTLPFALVTIPGVPALMWLTLRWLEDAVSAGRACAAFVRLLRLGKENIHQTVLTRAELHARVMSFATAELGLPPDPEQYFSASGGREKGRVRSNWESGRKYFSVRRRRKRDWNETLRLYETVDYPADD
jgi:glycerol-3-phosphate O-acyltransferase / dihydroxyacetone phosphate acyltransferase